MKRGEVWTVSGGPGYAGKPRPAVIVQDDAYAPTNSVAVCGLTHFVADSKNTRPRIEPSSDNGLNEPSWIMVDKITTVPRTRLGRRIGRLSGEEVAAVDQALLIFLGLAA